LSFTVVTWSHGMESLGSACAAIGVFDGVHVGHRALLRDTVADAQRRGVRSVAVTFDRDPDQVVSPDTAAPQLLTLADKLGCIAETGINVILVVPFTHELAEMTPETFVEQVLLSAMEPVDVHVGNDFRFGARAAGDVETLERIGIEHGFEVCPYDLVTVDGSPVTSTRIRGLVSAGEVAPAGKLLCRSARVTGTVHRGRGEGARLGFPTANLTPVPFAALPADGVYAGRAILEDGTDWPAAISVGTPPSFPDARDYLEVHLIGFRGDLYGQTLTVEILERLHDHHAFASTEELETAIAEDVDAARAIAKHDDEDATELSPTTPPAE
jgi:riboflavin kinase / FMN adenylyltransferase